MSETREAPALAPCPDRPNCVSSQAPDEAHRVAPLALGADPARGWERLVRLVESWPRTRVVARTPEALDAEVSSRLFGFIDDLSLRFDPEAGVAHVRSASRTGYSDLGVNRRRVEELRAAFASPDSAP